MDSADPGTNWRATCRGLQAKLRYILTQTFLTDLTINLVHNGTTEFRVHRIFLTMTSEVFEKMLSSNSEEKMSKVIEIKDIEPNIFYLLLQHMYGQIIPISNVEEAWNLFAVANKYLVTDTSDFCLDYIRRNLTPGNAVKCLEMAEKFNIFELKQECFRIMQEKTNEVLQCGGLLEADVSTFQALLEQERLNIKEIDLFKAFQSWMKSSILNKGEPMKELICKSLIPQFSFLSMTPQEFQEGPGMFEFISDKEKYAILSNLCTVNCSLPLPEGFRSTKRIHMGEITTDPVKKSIITLGENDLGIKIGLKVNKTVKLTAVKVFTRENESGSYEEDNIVRLKSLDKAENDWESETEFKGKVNCKSTNIIKLEKPYELIGGKIYVLSIFSRGKYIVIDFENVILINDDNISFELYRLMENDKTFTTTIPLASLFFDY